MTAFYYITKYLTFPGAYVRCFWEQIVCRICGVPVEDNRYLRQDEMCSHVDHELMPTASSAFAICFVPAFLNGLCALLLGVLPTVFLFAYGTTNIILLLVSAVSYWFASSLYLNSYSLIEDALNMMEKIYKGGNIFQKIIYAPGAAALIAGAYLERYGITFIASVIFTASLLFIF